MNIYKSLIIAGAFVAALGTLTAGAASAQSLPVVGPPNGIAAGVFIPSSAAAKDAGTNQFTAELRYGLPGVPLTPTRTVVAVGYEGGSKNGNSSTIIPLTIAEYYGTGQFSPLSPSKPYVGAGSGIYFGKRTGKGTTTNLGGFIAAGYNFTVLFAEAKYQFVKDGNGFVFNLGLRF
ncbi:MAG TPA: hypothetical protein VGK19_12840 [Capsulimonadaceae bacterium]